MFGEISFDEYTRIYNQAYKGKIPGVKNPTLSRRNSYFENLMDEYRARRAETALQALGEKGE